MSEVLHCTKEDAIQVGQKSPTRASGDFHLHLSHQRGSLGGLLGQQRQPDCSGQGDAASCRRAQRTKVKRGCPPMRWGLGSPVSRHQADTPPLHLLAAHRVLADDGFRVRTQ